MLTVQKIKVKVEVFQSSLAGLCVFTYLNTKHRMKLSKNYITVGKSETWRGSCVFCVFEQPAITPCTPSQHKMGKTSRIFCRFIWMRFSFLVCESRISGETYLQRGLKASVSQLYRFILFFHLFRQEGWRLENENPSDPNSPLIFKGVVFNEMKGAFVSHRFPIMWSLLCSYTTFSNVPTE